MLEWFDQRPNPVGLLIEAASSPVPFPPTVARPGFTFVTLARWTLITLFSSLLQSSYLTGEAPFLTPLFPLDTLPLYGPR